MHPKVVDSPLILLDHILLGREFGPLLRAPERPRLRDEWRAMAQSMARGDPPSAELAERFHHQWHVCHHFVRELVADDHAILDMLWTWLPRYGGGDVVLYRGENLSRFTQDRVGFAWSDTEEMARMFGSGLNAVAGGGALLRAYVPASAVIAAPSKHSRWLGESEFTVDPRRLGSIELLGRFPESR